MWRSSTNSSWHRDHTIISHRTKKIHFFLSLSSRTPTLRQASPETPNEQILLPFLLLLLLLLFCFSNGHVIHSTRPLKSGMKGCAYITAVAAKNGVVTAGSVSVTLQSYLQSFKGEAASKQGGGGGGRRRGGTSAAKSRQRPANRRLSPDPAGPSRLSLVLNLRPKCSLLRVRAKKRSVQVLKVLQQRAERGIAKRSRSMLCLFKAVGSTEDCEHTAQGRVSRSLTRLWHPPVLPTSKRPQLQL